MQAKRICELIELFGVNTFSSMDEHNVWGSWPADYRPEQVIAALKYLTAETGFALPLREYHYAGRESFQRPWLGEIKTAIPGTKVTLCVGANGTEDDVQTMLDMPADWYEGLNEPNTDFGSGEVPVETTVAIQHAVWQPLPRPNVMGPSIVGGMPEPAGWVRGYCGDQLDELNAQMTIGNGHFYPPHCPDLTGDGCSLSEYVGSLLGAYGHPIMLTEFHPTLYNADGNGPKQPGWDGQRDAYYTLLALFRAGRLDVRLWWYALFDYGTTYECGLFPTKAENPRPAATVLRRLCLAAADGGPTMRSFAPGNLSVTVEGMNERCDWDLYQSSDGKFLLPLWRAGADPGGDISGGTPPDTGGGQPPDTGGGQPPGGGAGSSGGDARSSRSGEPPTIVQVVFGQPCAHITEHDLLTGELWEMHDTSVFEVWLTNTAHLLVIEP